MRTLSSRVNVIPCWIAVGLLSACTVEVVDKTDDSPDAAASDDSSSSGEESNTGESSETAPADGGMGTDESTDDVATFEVPFENDAGSSSGEPVTEGDGGAPAGARIECGSRDVEDATVIDDTIRDDVTLSGTVYVKGAIDVVDGVTVTIEPGTHIIMAVDSDLEFGWNGGAVTVKAEGTEAAPITICGEEAEAGYWRSVTFGSNVTSNSTFKNVLVSDGGASVAAVVFNADVHVENLQVADSDAAGVQAVDFADDSERLSVFGAGGAAVVLTGQNALTHFPLGGVFEDNAENQVVVEFDSMEGSDAVVVHDVGIPYLQADSIDVLGTVSLEFEAGVVYRFASDTELEVGWNGSAPTLAIQGTEEDPVVFEGQGAEAGYWRGLIVRSNVRSSSTIEYLVLRHGGADAYNSLWIESPITVTHVMLEMNETGALIGRAGLDPDSSDLSITETEGVPLTLAHPDALVTLPRGGSFEGNDDDVIAIDDNEYTVTGTVYNLGVPYRVLNDIDTMDDSSMTIEAGTVFEMDADTSVEFGWNGGAAEIIAVGTEEAPIVFKGSDPTAGSWEGLLVNRNVTSGSKFQYVTIEHAGNSTTPEDGAAIHLDANVEVSNCTFNDIDGYGVILTGEANPAIVTDNTISGDTLAEVSNLLD